MKTIIIGYGNLGKIYAKTLIKSGMIEESELYILRKSLPGRLVGIDERENSIGHEFTKENIPSVDADLIIISVKPQDFNTIINPVKQLISKNTIVFSVMAGITIEMLQKSLNCEKVVRAMPNSPIEYGLGITGYKTASALSKPEVEKIEELLSTTGDYIYFEDESLLNSVTALSGSGPAYFFYILKQMVEAGKELGFTEEISTQLVKQTMFGAFRLYDRSGKTLDELITTVASKGGTTFAAFEVFDEYKMREALTMGLKRARDRGLELSKVN
jgi:pyrroline-5-carboxylate reductase